MLTDRPEDESEEQGPEDKASVPSVNIRLVERNAEEEKDDTLTHSTGGGGVGGSLSMMRVSVCKLPRWYDNTSLLPYSHMVPFTLPSNSTHTGREKRSSCHTPSGWGLSLGCAWSEREKAEGF